MKEFFHGWRRKAGVVTLGLACVSAAIWIRGTVVTDQFQFGDSRQYQAVEVREDCLMWGRVQAFGHARLGVNKMWRVSPRGQAGSFMRLMHSTFNNDGWEWRQVGLGFDFGQTRIDNGEGDQLTLWTVPHWSIAIPLTLLSAYLLLVPPGKRPPTKSQPHA